MADGPNERRGRALAYLRGKWGTICDKDYLLTGWPRTFCGDMGYKHLAAAPRARMAAEGVGTGHIAWQGPICPLLSNLKQCLGNKDSCTHYYDVVVECTDDP